MIVIEIQDPYPIDSRVAAFVALLSLGDLFSNRSL